MFALALMSVSCRQEGDMLTDQDVTNLKIIQETRNSRENNSSTNIIIQNDDETDVNKDMIPPPKK